jgi:hypothetical protein
VISVAEQAQTTWNKRAYVNVAGRGYIAGGCGRWQSQHTLLAEASHHQLLNPVLAWRFSRASSDSVLVFAGISFFSFCTRRKLQRRIVSCLCTSAGDCR